ncbi:sensor histidine kinase [Trinickia sp.]|uniref:sensor histidine kinase n=1 Tax=Trinickia sp. TaxID=2571163 RepID=UPI003F82177F
MAPSRESGVWARPNTPEKGGHPGIAEMENHILEGQTLDWLLSSAADALIIIDRDGRIVLANRPAERMFGYPNQGMIGQMLEVLIPERFRRTHVAERTNYFSQPRARPMGVGMELRGQRNDGVEIPIEVSLSPLETDRGLKLVMATIHDVSLRKRAEQAVLDSEVRMRAIVDTAADAIITIHGTGVIERVNPRTEQLFGYSGETLVGKNIDLLMPALLHALSKAELVGGTRRELTANRADGSQFPVELSLSEFQLGASRMFTVMARDITERQESEERRRALMQGMTAANEELTNFAYVVSHDLKAPLRGIASLADWLSQDYADKFDAQGREHMRLLIRRVHRMSALIDGILEYSRAGRIKETSMRLDMNALMREIVDLLAPPSSIQILVATPLPILTADKTRIQQVLQNLLSNAIKYMDKPAGRIRVDCVEQDEVLLFSVSDNGPGIEKRHFERIFQLFQTLAPRDQVESTGVGLALVKKIVEMYGGRVWVESEVGTGSTFFFTLPRQMLAARTEDRA